MSRRVLEQYGHPLPSGARARMGSRAKRVPRILAAYRQALARRRQSAGAGEEEPIGDERQLFVGQEVRNLREMMVVIRAHARALRTVIVKYRKQSNGQIVTREVEPYSIRIKNTRFHGRRRYLYAYDLFRSEIRAFIVDNLTSVQGTSNTFAPRWKVEF